MLVLWGRHTSVNVQKVIWLLAELGMEFDRKDVGGPFGGLNTPEYIAMNPNQLVPTLQDGKITIWESEAILRYLGAKYGEQYFPGSIEKRAVVDQWLCWSQSSWIPPLIQLFMFLMKTPAAKRDSQQLKDFADNVNARATFMNEQLKTRKFIAGDSLSLADFSFASWLYRYFTLEIERPSLENLEQYYDMFCSHSVYVQHVHVDYGWMRVKE